MREEIWGYCQVSSKMDSEPVRDIQRTNKSCVPGKSRWNRVNSLGYCRIAQIIALFQLWKAAPLVLVQHPSGHQRVQQRRSESCPLSVILRQEGSCPGTRRERRGSRRGRFNLGSAQLWCLGIVTPAEGEERSANPCHPSTRTGSLENRGGGSSLPALLSTKTSIPLHLIFSHHPSTHEAHTVCQNQNQEREMTVPDPRKLSFKVSSSTSCHSACGEKIMGNKIWENIQGPVSETH